MQYDDSLENIDFIKRYVTHAHSCYIITHQGLNCKLVEFASSQSTAV